MPASGSEGPVIQASTISVRVLHLTDPHLFADPTASLRGIVTYSSLNAVLEHFQGGDWSADVVAMTGDLIQDDSAGAYRQFRDMMSSLNLPVHCVPGNHDVRALMKDALSDPPFFYCDTYSRDDWTMVGVDSCVSGSAGGHVADSEMDRLRTVLDRVQTSHVLVCLHHPPQPMGSRWLDRVGLSNGEEFLAALAKSGQVRGCLFGHAHQDFEGTFGSLRVIGTPSTCRQFKPSSDEFALDDRPPAYRRVTLRQDGTIDTELLWLPRSQSDAFDA